MFFELKNPYVERSDRPFLLFSSLEGAMLKSIDLVMASCERQEIMMEEPEDEITDYKPGRKHHKHNFRKHLRDNTPLYKERNKNTKKYQRIAKERRGEQYFTFRDPEHNDYEIVPFSFEKAVFKDRKNNEAMKNALLDEKDISREQARNLGEIYVECREALHFFQNEKESLEEELKEYWWDADHHFIERNWITESRLIERIQYAKQMIEDLEEELERETL